MCIRDSSYNKAAARVAVGYYGRASVNLQAAYKNSPASAHIIAAVDGRTLQNLQCSIVAAQTLSAVVYAAAAYGKFGITRYGHITGIDGHTTPGTVAYILSLIHI